MVNPNAVFIYGLNHLNKRGYINPAAEKVKTHIGNALVKISTNLSIVLDGFFIPKSSKYAENSLRLDCNLYDDADDDVDDDGDDDDIVLIILLHLMIRLFC
jgi:hypothetical protein